MHSRMQLVFILVLLYNVQCSSPIEDRTTLALRQLQDKLQETKQAILNQFIGNISVPKRLQEEYGILGSLRIWEKMDSWTRPEESSDRSSQLPSLALELSDRVQPDSLDLVVIKRLVYKFYKDIKRKVYICSVKLYTDAYHPTFELLARFNGTGVKLFPTMCGKGACFIMKQIIGGYHLIVANKILPYKFKEIEQRLINILFFFSRSDSINLDIQDLEFGAKNEVQTKTISNFKVIYNKGRHILIDSSTTEESLKITSQIDCEDVVFGKDGLIQPYNYFDPGLPDDYVVINSSRVTVTNNVLTNQLDLNLTDSRLQDGVLSSSVPVELAPNTLLIVNKRYLVHPSGQQTPTSFQKETIVSRADIRTFQVHSHAALYFTIYGLSSPEVTIYKIVDGDGTLNFPGIGYLISKYTGNSVNDIERGNFPGFEYLISRHIDYTVLVVQTYETKLHDTGVYLIEARSGSKSVFKNFTVGIYEDKARHDSFGFKPKTIVKNGTSMKVAELTCTTNKKPRPTITFYESLANLGLSNSDYTKGKPIVNNDIFEIMALNVTDDLVSRSIIVHKFPSTTNRGYVIICELYDLIHKEVMTGYVYLSYFQ